jgi:hypothetical protein
MVSSIFPKDVMSMDSRPRIAAALVLLARYLVGEASTASIEVEDSPDDIDEFPPTTNPY